MIPKDNLRNLVLREDVVDAARKGEFHIYGVSTIDEGVEVLTGVPAGQPQDDGEHPEGTVHRPIVSRFKELTRNARQLRKQDEDGERDKTSVGNESSNLDSERS
jgi:predicted ATP-dependent protease